MEIQVEKQTLSSCCLLREAKTEQPVDCDITLPDYCGDMKSILNCSIEPYITSGGASGSRIGAQGNAVVRLVYLGEDDKIVCFEQSYPISKFTEMSGLPQEASCRISAKTDYVNCRAVNPRRVDVHGCVTVLFSAYGKEKTDVVSSAPTDGLYLKQSDMQTYDFIGCSSKLFEMSDTVTVPANQSAVKGVIHTQAFPTVKDVKAVKGKVLIRGDVSVGICYCGEDGSIAKAEHTMPINQIAEVEGVAEDSLCDVRLTICSIDVPFKADSNGELRQAEAAVTVRADIFAYSSLELRVATDAYSVKECLETEQRRAKVFSICEKIDELFVVPCELDFSDAPVSELLDVWCDGVTSLFDETKPDFEVCGTVSLCLLYRDADGRFALAHRACNYRINKDLTKTKGCFLFDPWLCVDESRLTSNGTSVGGKLQLHLRGCVFEKQEFDVIGELRADETKPIQNKAAITVYFGSDGEEIWEIAKRYHTSCEAVKQRNRLVGERMDHDGILIIPKI
ncbi:MAG TPA: hypothetical protein DDY98_00535 [Ruminococcaceae bacterium]|nr:hypothetical protein [Oscillospiraceae bacterium]